MKEKKEVTPIDFLVEGIAKAQKYVPYDEAPEVIEARTAQEKDAWREVYSFAHMTNKSGRNFTETDVIHLCERFLLSVDKVRKVFVKIYAEYADAYGIDEKPEIYKVEYFLRRNWEFIRNEVTQRSEYRPAKTNDEFEKLNVHTLYRKLQHVNFKFSKEKLDSLLKSDFMKSYNPFVDYFEGLPKWDYERDYIGELANFVTTTDQQFHVTQFRKMLVRCIGCSLYGVENRFVYVFIGAKQEKGKSTYIRFLSPFGKRYYTEAPIRDNKDTYFSFAENFLYNIEELASTTNFGVNQLKAIISMAMIKERKPHATDVEEQPRRSNFFASTNKDEFLTDSENTRWLCVNVLDIDWSYKSKVDINKVWAQAYALYHDPEFNQNLTTEENAERDAVNKNYEITDIEKDLIKQCFEISHENDPQGSFYSNPDILSTLQEKFGGKTLNSKFIGKSMVQLGFISGSKRINGHKMRGYYVRLRTTAGFKSENPEEDIAPPEINNDQTEIDYKF